MLFNIPQFIDKEDKLVGPLTAKQLGWLGGAGAVLILFWAVLDTGAFILASMPVLAIFAALAFYRPNGESLISFIASAVNFTLKPKMYIWSRLPEIIKSKKASHQKVKIIQNEKRVVNENKIEEISKMLDNKN